MSDYRSQLDKAYNTKVLQSLSRVTRQVALDVQADLVLNTPVDTGRARSNWLPSFDFPRKDKTSDKNGSPIIDFSGYRVGQTIFIANNLPYISRLNAGISKQAPAGFVEASILRAKKNAKRVLKVINAKLQ